jgi:hypothetical protein
MSHDLQSVFLSKKIVTSVDALAFLFSFLASVQAMVSLCQLCFDTKIVSSSLAQNPESNSERKKIPSLDASALQHKN